MKNKRIVIFVLVFLTALSFAFMCFLDSVFTSSFVAFIASLVSYFLYLMALIPSEKISLFTNSLKYWFQLAGALKQYKFLMKIVCIICVTLGVLSFLLNLMNIG